MKNILITNDDGIQAPALDILEEKFSRLGNVTVVAPEFPMNAKSSSISLHKPVRICKYSRNRYSVSGTPADSCRVGILSIMDDNVDFVVSGINDGANLGDDISYSGTVAAAREAALLRVPSLAVSLVIDKLKNFNAAGDIAFEVASRIISRGIPERKLLNLNVPDIPAENIKGIKLSRLGIRIYERKVREREDPAGRKYYWIIGESIDGHSDSGTDFEAISQDYASLTPVTLDSTDYDFLKELGNWDLN
ncbi:MAG: 5'/3'-nucleotidase SurE [Elusimicrobiota bacterium]